MCLVLQSEVILANVLSHAEDVDMDGLAEYCREVKIDLAKLSSMSSEYVYFDLDEQSIYNAVGIFDNLFVLSGERISSNREINVDYFNSRYGEEISHTLKNAAVRYVSASHSR